MLVSLLYYSSMRFIIQLLPLLLFSQLPAHIVSVFSPKRNDKIFPEDLSLRNPKNYGFMNMGSHVAYVTTFFFESLASKYLGELSLSRCYPGLVMHEGVGKDKKSPAWFNFAMKVMSPVMRLTSVDPTGSGERVLFHATSIYPAMGTENTKGDGNVEVALSSDGTAGGGAYRTDWNGEIDPCGKIYKKLREDGMKEKVWSHTVKAFEDIEAGRVFTG